MEKLEFGEQGNTFIANVENKRQLMKNKSDLRFKSIIKRESDLPLAFYVITS